MPSFSIVLGSSFIRPKNPPLSRCGYFAESGLLYLLYFNLPGAIALRRQEMTLSPDSMFLEKPDYLFGNLSGMCDHAIGSLRSRYNSYLNI